MNRIHEHHSRSIVKAVTYRILIVVSNGILMFAITHDTGATYKVMAYSTVISTALYYAHERVWNGIHWGRKHITKK